MSFIELNWFRLNNVTIYFLILSIATLFSCHSNLNKKEDLISEEIRENEIWNPFIILSRKNKKIVEVEAKKLYKNNNESTLLVGDVTIDFYSDEGNHISVLYSDSARINEDNNDLMATGNVFVLSDSGYTLATQKIIWNNSYKMIIAEDSVMFTTLEGDTLYGIGFESDADLEEWRIFRPFGIAREGI